MHRPRALWLPILMLLWMVAIALLVVACETPTAPTVVRQSVAPLVVTPPAPIPVPVPASCSSARPVLRVSSGERVGDRWKNFLTWERLDATEQVYIVAYRNWLEVAERTLTTDWKPQVERYDFGDGVFEARIRLACSSVWSAAVTFTNGCGLVGCGVGGPAAPPVPPKPPKPPHCTGKHGCK